MIQNHALTGGREGKIFKQADCIVRPANLWTEHVHGFLNYLLERGFDCIPHPMGFTDDGREMVSFVDGVVHNDGLPDEIMTDEVLADVARLLRRYHDIGADYVSRLTGEEKWMLPQRTPAEVMCHGDFAPYNITFVEGKLHGIIDFDTLHPGPRLWDIAYAAYRWVPFVSSFNPDCRDDAERQIARLKRFADAYGMSGEMRTNLPDMMIGRIGALVDYMRGEAEKGNEDVLRNIAEGHMELYLSDIAHIKAQRQAIIDALAKSSKS